MKVVLQRVSEAEVKVDGEIVGAIGPGLMILLGVVNDDTEKEMTQLAEKILGVRIFADAEGKMNRSIVDVGGSILLVSQFTLAADCRKGRRPSFTDAAPPAVGKALYAAMANYFRASGIPVATGVFGANMAVSLVNDGPVTIVLDSRDL